MGSHRVVLRSTRLWYSRRTMWRAALILVALSFMSLWGLLWSFSLDGMEVSLRQREHDRPGLRPPPQYDKDVNEDAEAGGKTPFRRPSGNAPTLSAPPSSPTNAVPSASTLWFNATAAGAGEGDQSRMTGFYQSIGVARVVLTASPADPETDATTPQPPHLLASNVSWRAYELYVQAEGNKGKTRDAEHDFPKMHVRALEQVEVQLLRQRVTRNAWATSTHTKSDAIVGVVPVEPATLANADELLVELQLRAEDRPSTNPDPSRFVPLAAATVSGRDESGKRTSSLHIDEPANLLTRATDGAERAARSPLVELKVTPRYAVAKDEANAAANVDTEVASPTTTTLTWRTDDVDASHPLTLDVTLDVVRPRRVHGNDMNTPHTGAAEDEVYTNALQATVCGPRLVRLYGISPSLLQNRKTPQQEQQADTAAGNANHGTDMTDDLESIPLNMQNGIDVTVGGPSTATPHERMAGVVPLLYLELDASDGHQAQHPPPTSAVTRRTVGLLWLHPAPFIVFTFARAAQTCVRLRSTAGSTKLFLLPGPTPADVLRQYYTLTGFPTLPPRFLLGYHHGLRSAAASTEKAVEALDASFLRSRVPLDSVWATDAAVAAKDTPFTWNTTRFPDVVRLQSNLWYGGGRRYVVVRTVPTIPITIRSPLFLEGRRENYFVTLNAEEVTGWPTRSLAGVPSHVVDFTNPSARRWYGNMLKYRRYVGSTNHTFISLQNAAPTVMVDSAPNAALPGCAAEEEARVGAVLPMEVGHYGGFTHREVHQLMSVNFARAVHEGMLRRTQYVRRALVLSESFYAGIQRYAVVQVETQPACQEEKEAVTTTKSALAAAWAQLRRAVRQCAQLSVLGVPFSGANLGAGLTPEVLTELLRRPLTAETVGAVQEDAEDGNEEEEEAQEGRAVELFTPAPHTTQAPAVLREAEELLMRWYQAGVFFAAMYTVENVAEPSHQVGDADAEVAAPWWMRLPVDSITATVIQTNVRVRYALVPYLYSVAYNVSETGSSFFAPLRFTEGGARRVTHQADSSSPTCYAVGDAVVVCPVTRSAASQRVTSDALGKIGAGLFDLWTGVWRDGASTAQTDVAAAAEHGCAFSSGTPLHWLTTSGRKVSAAAAAAAPLPFSAFLAPAFLRPGFIVATQNVLPPSDDTVPDNIVHSTHMGANWTLTVGLPPLPTAKTTSVLPASQLLAEGEVYWDEGSRNSQQRPPAPQAGEPRLTPSFPVIPLQAHRCRLHLRCFYQVRDGAAARLVVEVHQTSASCAEALAQLQSHWQEVPEGFAERWTRAKERRDARQHAREMEQDEREDRGARAARGHRQPAESYIAEDLSGLRLPRWSEEAARNDLWRSHLLHRIRFLFQNEEDAAKLADLQRGAAAAAVAVERRGVTADVKSETTTLGIASASRSAITSHEVQVDFTQGDTAAAGKLLAAPLFGAVNVVESSGQAVLRVPPTYTWRFIFPLG
jgi:alpha-glucosidase (family GH31 glycosyl hydrolase)